MKKDIEIRIIPDEDSEVRLARGVTNGRKIEGYGIVFNKESRDLGGFVEKIMPDAIKGVLDRSDVLALLNHNTERGVLARSKNGKGTLKLNIDDKGVLYEFESPNTNLGNEVIEGITRGDITTSSFAFSIFPKGDKWEKRSDGSYLRTILKFDKIYDVSAVYREAYPDTTVALRNLDEVRNENITINLEELKATNEVSTTEIETKSVIVEPVIEPIVERKTVEPIVVKEKPKNQNSNNLKHLNMTIVELRSARADLIAENMQIFEAKDTEKRAMTQDEESLVASNNQKVKELDLQIETETRKQGEGKIVGPYFNIAKKEPFSLIKAIRAKVEQREMPGIARDIFSYGRNEFRNSGLNAMGDVVIPTILPPELRTALTSGGALTGQEIVAEDKRQILPPLVDKLIFTQAGATYMTGLVGNVSIPSYAGTTVGWKTEVDAADDGTGATAEVNFSPLRLTAYILVSKLFLAQDAVGAERLLLENISNAVARMLEKTVLGPATLSAGEFPSGIGYKINNASNTKRTVLTGATITNAAFIAMETRVDTANAGVGNLAYITNSKGRGLLKSTDKGLSNDTGDFICSESNMVNGYPLLVTNSIVSTYGTGGDGNLVVFGNWKDLCIAQWGGYDVTVDPYTAAASNEVKIVINAYFDAKGLRGANGTSGANLDEYAISFACESVK